MGSWVRAGFTNLCQARFRLMTHRSGRYSLSDRVAIQSTFRESRQRHIALVGLGRRPWE